MIKELSDTQIELGTSEFMCLNELKDIKDLRKYTLDAINFGSKLTVDLKKNEFEEMMDEMYQSYLNEQAIKEGEKCPLKEKKK